MALQTSDIKDILKKHLKSLDFEIISCVSSDSKDRLKGFFSTQENACITYRTPNCIEGKLNIFIKRLPESEHHRANVLSMGVFLREAVIYNKILNRFQAMLGDDTIPKCYLARSDDIVVLEDMGKRNFRTKDVFEAFDLAECEVTLEALAKFHALSLVTESREGRLLTESVPIIQGEVNILPAQDILVTKEALMKVADLYLSRYPGKVRKKSFEQLESIKSELAKCSTIHPKVLAHSDLYSNNIMLKYNSSGVAEKACLIDFQLATYKPPSYDILLFLHTSTESAFRVKHQDHLLKHYYSKLSCQLSSFGIDIEGILSWPDFEKMLDLTLPTVLSMTCFYLHFALPKEIWLDIISSDAKYQYFYKQDRSQAVLKGIGANKCYRDRVLRGLISLLDYYSSIEG